MPDKRPDETNNVPEPPSIGDLPTMGEGSEPKPPAAEPPSIGDLPTLGEGAAPKHPAVEPPSIGDLPTEGEWAIRDDQRFHSRRWQPGEEILGRYVVEKELGQGGMGVVYACFDKVGGVRVAVKALPPELSHNTVEMEEVRENFQLVDELRHPNIAGVRTLEKDARGEYFLVMDIAEGESLRKWLRRKWKAGGVPLAEAVGILQQVAAALDYAHGERILHRDVKPGNVVIDANGRVKVLDFGLAAQIHTSLSRASQAYHGTSGTGPYMAPEQWRGQPQDAKTDQYALGVMACEMLSGRLPFENADAVALREAVLREEAPVIPNLPKHAMSAIRRAMAKKADDRFGRCREFVAALAGPKPGSVGRGGGWGWLLAVSFAVALGAGIWWWQERPTVSRGQEAQQEFTLPGKAPEEAEAGSKATEERLAAQQTTVEEAQRRLQEAERRARESEAARKKLEETVQRQRDWDARLAKLERQERQSEALARAGVASHPADGLRTGTIDLGGGTTIEMVHCPGVARNFWMGKYEVTQEQWQRVMETEPSHFKNKPKNPVENVSWNDCRYFIQKLNALPAAKASGLTFRLPTEKEWESACRAGAPESEDYCKLADGTQITAETLGEVARYGEGWDDGPATVGSFLPNAWGLYDMHGNVWEWTQTAVGGNRVNRGGSFNLWAGFCAAGERYWDTPDIANRNLGFRLAASGRIANR